MDKNPVDFPLEKIKSYIDSTPSNLPIKLLGGEPSLHKDFLEIIKYIHAKGKVLTVFTNLLTDHSIWADVAKFSKDNNYPMGLTLNSTELYGQRASTFKTNIAILKEALLIHFCFGYTIGEDFDDSVVDFNFLSEFISNHNSNLRISSQVPFPGSKSSVVHNKKIGNHMMKFVNRINYTGDSFKRAFRFDCQALPCWFSDKDWQVVKDSRHSRFCSTPPLDVFCGDGTSMYGLCCQDLVYTTPEDEPFNYKKTLSSLINQYHAEDKKIGFLPVCEACKYMGKDCLGPCLAFKRHYLGQL